jgi:hypothetical protein
MMRGNLIFVLLFFLACVLSCDEIIISNISDDRVILTSPDDSLHTKLTHQIFSWEKVNSAMNYKLSVQSNGTLILDSLLDENSFAMDLDTGKYEWCVKAVNAGYETQSSCRVLEIYREVSKPENIGNTKINLLAPADSLESTNPEQLFWWDKISGASAYELVIVTPDINAPTAIVTDTTISGNSLSFELTKGNYQWCVRGINDEFKTTYSCRVLKVK